MSTETWNELVTVGLLGTDRRDPPVLPDGPVADVVADALLPTPQGRLLASVSAIVVARRCGALPRASRAPLMPPADDQRPMIPVTAARRWHAIAASWPVLEPEWLAAATAYGWRPSPDVLVAMLGRHRRNATVSAAVAAFGGPLAPWLIEHRPDLAPFPSKHAPSADPRVLPVPAELAPLLDGPGEPIAGAIVGGLVSGLYRWSHRAVLLNTVARVRRSSLEPLIAIIRAARDRVDPNGHRRAETGAPLSLWESLLELAAVRRDMLEELETPLRSPSTQAVAGRSSASASSLASMKGLPDEA